MQWIFPSVAFLFLAGPLAAQDGGQLYAQYCAACHGADGRGAGEGVFPPLAESPWVADAPERAIKVVLHGLHGPIDVNGRSFNLEMPPQGAVLPDDHIAAILTYVRSSWGNQAGRVEPDVVARVREEMASRKGAWTADELLKLHPLPLQKTAIADLISRSYSGRWTEMPDFSTLTAASVEEEHDGLLDVSDAPFEDHFAILWEGRFEAPEEGLYEFLVDADDAATVWLDGKQVVAVTGTGQMNGSRAKVGKIPLAKGSHPIRIGYLEAVGEQSIALGWRLDGAPDFRWLSARRSLQGGPKLRIPVEPENGRPVIYRNFIEGTSARAIGIGFPGDLNLAWSADHLAPELLWTGAFIDGGPKWLERGTRPSPPAGENLARLSSDRFLPEDARFRGYKLDEMGNPAFVVTIGRQTFHDSWCAGATDDGAPCLIRTLTLNGGSTSLHVPLGHFADIRSSVRTVSRGGVPTVELKPGMRTKHQYVFPH